MLSETLKLASREQWDVNFLKKPYKEYHNSSYF